MTLTVRLRVKQGTPRHLSHPQNSLQRTSFRCGSRYQTLTHLYSHTVRKRGIYLSIMCGTFQASFVHTCRHLISSCCLNPVDLSAILLSDKWLPRSTTTIPPHNISHALEIWLLVARLLKIVRLSDRLRPTIRSKSATFVPLS